MALIRTPCGKCGGRGRIEAFAGIAGGVCFACKGVGYFEQTEKQVEAAKKRKATRAAQHEKDQGRIAQLNRDVEVTIKRYRDDPRMGRETRERYNRFPAVAYETAKHLAKVDADPAWAASKPWILDGLRR